jgi:hypothetical protein
MTSAERVKQEMEAFRQLLPKLLEEHAGQWVVFFEGKALEFYADEEAAYKAAMKRFGPGSGFLVAPVEPEQPQPTKFSLLFGVTR